MSEHERPPIGLRPRFIWLEQRLQEIKDACDRYINAQKPIPREWLDESKVIRAELRKRKPGDKFIAPGNLIERLKKLMGEL